MPRNSRAAADTTNISTAIIHRHLNQLVPRRRNCHHHHHHSSYSLTLLGSASAELSVAVEVATSITTTAIHATSAELSIAIAASYSSPLGPESDDEQSVAAALITNIATWTPSRRHLNKPSQTIEEARRRS